MTPWKSITTQTVKHTHTHTSNTQTFNCVAIWLQILINVMPMEIAFGVKLPF